MCMCGPPGVWCTKHATCLMLGPNMIHKHMTHDYMLGPRHVHVHSHCALWSCSVALTGL